MLFLSKQLYMWEALMKALAIGGLIALLIFLAIVRSMFLVEVEEPEENSDAEE